MSLRGRLGYVFSVGQPAVAISESLQRRDCHHLSSRGAKRRGDLPVTKAETATALVGLAATVLIVKQEYWLIDWIYAPDFLLAKHGVENDQKLSHAGCKGDFLLLSTKQEIVVEAFDHRVPFRCHEGCHV